MELVPRLAGDVFVVEIREDRLDAAVAIQFKDALRDAVGSMPARIILDMGQVRFMDSSGLGAVIGAMKRLAPGQKLELAGLNPAVDKVFRLTRMDKIFTIHANADSIGLQANAG